VTLYLDTSSLARLYIDEVGSDTVRALVRQAAVVTTSQIAYAEFRGITLDVERIASDIQADFGPDLAALRRGTRLDASRVDALKEKIRSATKKATRLAAKDSMRSLRQELMDRSDEREVFERMYIWVAKMRRTCPSCKDRHGMVKAMDSWIDLGRPGDGTTLCGKECECSLLPYSGGRESTREKQL